MGRILLIGILLVAVFLTLTAIVHAAAPYLAALVIVYAAAQALLRAKPPPDG